MRSNNKGFVSQIEDLLLEIEKLEHLISMHRKASHSIEVKQFESLKLGFVKELLTLLINSKLNLAEPQTFPLVYKLLENFYPESMREEVHSPEYMAVESVLSPVLFKRGVYRNYAGAAEPEVKYGD